MQDRISPVHCLAPPSLQHSAQGNKSRWCVICLRYIGLSRSYNSLLGTLGFSFYHQRKKMKTKTNKPAYEPNLTGWLLCKLDGVGPADNRPSTNMLHHFVRKKKKKCDMWHMTCDTWHVTWHMTHDMWHVWGVNILSKFQLPSSYGLWFMILWIYGGDGWLAQLMNELMNQWRGCL